MNNPRWAIEVRSQFPEFLSDMQRAIVRHLQQSDPHGWATLQGLASSDAEIITIGHCDLSGLVWLSGRHRRVTRGADGRMWTSFCQVEIYPLGQPSVEVEFRSHPPLGLVSADPLMITGTGFGSSVTVPYRHKEGAAIKAAIVDILASRTTTDRKVLNWVLRPPFEYGVLAATGKQLTLQDYTSFFEGDFTGCLK